MSKLLIPIDIPNGSEFADDAAVLQMWEDVHALLSQQSAVFVVGREPTEWFGVSVDASGVVGSLKAQLERRTPPIPHLEPEEPERGLTLQLDVTCSGTSVSDDMFPTDRFVEQLFLACNLAEPGSCAFTGPESVISLDPALIDGACRLGRLPTVDSLEADFWPELDPVSFKEAWDWLHEDLSYDVEVATTPAQIAIFTMVLLASRSPLDPDNIVAVVRAIEAIYGRGGRENITKTVEERIERTFGRPAQYPRWFRQFYDQRSRLVHGDRRLLRPGLTHPQTAEAITFLEEHLGPLEHGVRLVMASLYRMIRSKNRNLED